MAAFSGQITVTTAGTAVQGPDIAHDQGTFFLKAAPANTGIIWIGNDGANDIASTNGFPLRSGESVIVSLTNLNDLWVDASVSGEKVCWMKA